MKGGVCRMIWRKRERRRLGGSGRSWNQYRQTTVALWLLFLPIFLTSCATRTEIEYVYRTRAVPLPLEADWLVPVTVPTPVGDTWSDVAVALGVCQARLIETNAHREAVKKLHEVQSETLPQ